MTHLPRLIKFVILPMCVLFALAYWLIAYGQNNPPATYYGWVDPGDGFAPTAGMTVTGSIGGKVCGANDLFMLESRLAYTLQVSSKEDVPGCGSPGSTVVFRVGAWEMNHDTPWNNQGATFHPLSVVRQPTPPATPTAAEPSTPTPTSTFVVITLTPTRTPTPTPQPTVPTPTDTPTPSSTPSSTPTEPPPPARFVFLPLVDR